MTFYPMWMYSKSSNDDNDASNDDDAAAAAAAAAAIAFDRPMMVAFFLVSSQYVVRFCVARICRVVLHAQS